MVTYGPIIIDNDFVSTFNSRVRNNNLSHFPSLCRPPLMYPKIFDGNAGANKYHGGTSDLRDSFATPQLGIKTASLSR